MTEATPREVRQQIRDRLAQMPAGVDADGHHDVDRARDAATIDRQQVLPDATPDPAPFVGMRPNPAQGGGATVPTPAPTDPLAAIRAKARKSL